jgi:hypothetical protein
MDMGERGIRPCGSRLDGQGPQDLILSDGSRLVLKSSETGEQTHWCRCHEDGTEELSIVQAQDLAGPEFSEYVEVRMRSEAEWLRALAQWAGAEARRIDDEAAVLI